MKFCPQFCIPYYSVKYRDICLECIKKKIKMIICKNLKKIMEK